MKNKKFSNGLWYIGLLVWWICYAGMPVYAQTDTGLEDKLILTEDNNFLICNDEGKQFRTTVNNGTTANEFRDGTFEVDMGNGTVKSGLSRNDFPLLITYTGSGEYQLKFSATTQAGVKVTRVYVVRALGRPIVDLRKVDENAQCIGSDVVYLVEVTDDNTEGTVYTLNYDDGTAADVMNNAELKVHNERFTHRYDHSYCEDGHAGSSHEQFEVKLTVKNECNYSDFKIISEHVVTPLDAKFTFDKRKHCTYEKVKLRNITTGGGNSDCTPGNIFWEWYYGNGKESNAFEPELTFEEAGNYPIKLIATNNYSCANDTTTEEVVLIDRVIAKFFIPDDTLCSGESLEFRNQSSGDDLNPFRWQIVPEDGGSAPVIVNGNFTTKHPVILFDRYGRFRVTLIASNDCSEARIDTVIVVKSDPNILKFDLPSEMCPPRLDLSQYMRFEWNGNEIKPEWTITKEDGSAGGFTFGDGTDKNSEFPKIDFEDPGKYNIQVELQSVGCGGTVLKKSGEILVHDPQVKMDVNTGLLNICESGLVQFTSNSVGENVVHKWTVSPSANTSFSGGATAGDRSPLLKFDKYGDYQVALNLKTVCTIKDTVFNVHVRKEPNIAHFEPQAAVCPDEIIDFHDCIIYQFWNNPEKAEWTITPDTGFEFLNGTDIHSIYPVIKFQTPGTYTFTVKLDPVACSMEGVEQELTRTVKVRNSSMTLKVQADDGVTVCEEGSLSFSMTAHAAEDDPIVFNWTVTPQSDRGNYLFEDYGSQKSLAKIRFNTWGTYLVRAEASGYCGTLDSTITVKVKRDPEVRLRDTSGLCPGIINLADYVAFEWYNNEQKVSWEITPAGSGTPADGFAYTGGTNANSVYPQVDFKHKGDYQVRATLTTAGCKEEQLVDLALYTIYDTTILVDVNPLGHTDICEGDAVAFRNMSEGVGLTYRWEIVGPDGGWNFAEGFDEQVSAPVISFTRYGEYEVTVYIEGTCNRKEKNFHIKVRGIPDVSLEERLTPICATSATVDMAEYVKYNDLKNSDVTYYWTITPGIGFNFEPGFGRDAQYPRIKFNDNDRYTLKLEVYSQCAAGGIQTLNTQVDVLDNSLKAIFNIDSAVCIPATLAINNLSEGDSLAYQWNIVAATASGGGWEFAGLNQETVLSPELMISEQGFYDVTLSIRNICGDDDSTFRIKAFAVPEVKVSDITGFCEPFVFSGRDRIELTENNDVVNKAEWTIVTTGVYDDFDKTVFYPDILFHAGDFQINAKYWNRCAEPGEVNFNVKVDEFVPIEPLRDTAVCVLTDPFLLTAKPDWGNWTSEKGEVIGKDGKYYFNPDFDAYFEGDIEVVYNLPNGTCLAKDTLKVHLHPLPRVEAGEAPQMCLNHDPLLLAGLPAGGYWESAGEILPENKYTPFVAGDFRVDYFYTDGKGCTNMDSTTLTVHPLPLTAFHTEALHCRNAAALFTPEQTDGNRFEWNFGDDTPVVISFGDTTHIYKGYGFFEVSHVVTSPYGCIDHSGTVKIEVVNLPPDPYFEVDKVNGCAPFNAVITIDPEKYVADHNYLSFAWDYGEGTKTDTMGPISPKYFPAGVWDTAYVTTFTVKNRCGEKKYDTVMTVNSLPVANFKLMHNWECSPVFLELQNTSTGNKCEFTWDFGDGSPVDHAPNATHEYTTGGTSTKYYITLKAVNKCETSVHTDSLVVKPRTISAHFSPAKSYACVGEDLCFKNNSTDTLGLIETVYWNFGDGTRDSLWDVCHSFHTDGVYQVYLYIENGCGFDTISDRIKVHPLPQLVLKSEDYLCETDTFTFVVTSDQELKRTVWDFGDGHAGMRDSMRYVYDGYGHYKVSVTGVAASLPACKSVVSKDIDVYNKPIVTISPMDTAHCTPLFYKPEVESTGVNFFVWDFGDGSEPDASGEHWYQNDTEEPQRYEVKVQVETDKGCKSDYNRKVTVYHLPHAGLDKEVTNGKPEKVRFVNLSEGNIDCIWQLPSGEILHSLNDQHLEFDRNGIYEVKMTAVNYYGCTDSVAVEHEVMMKGLYFPNTFIPISNNEKVNRFNGIGMGIRVYHLEIYDQFGNKIWETREIQDGMPSEGWDGKNKQGKMMPQGVYMWRARAVFGDDNVWTGKNNDSGVEQTVQGSVLLLRE